MAQSFEAAHVKRDVVVDDEDRSRAVISGIADICDDPIKRISMEVPASHLDDRAEAAIVGASARGFDHIHLPPENRVAFEHPSIAIGQIYLTAFETIHWSLRIVIEAVTAAK